MAAPSLPNRSKYNSIPKTVVPSRTSFLEGKPVPMYQDGNVLIPDELVDQLDENDWSLIDTQSAGVSQPKGDGEQDWPSNITMDHFLTLLDTVIVRMMLNPETNEVKASITYDKVYGTDFILPFSSIMIKDTTIKNLSKHLGFPGGGVPGMDDDCTDKYSDLLSQQAGKLLYEKNSKDECVLKVKKYGSNIKIPNSSITIQSADMLTTEIRQALCLPTKVTNTSQFSERVGDCGYVKFTVGDVLMSNLVSNDDYEKIDIWNSLEVPTCQEIPDEPYVIVEPTNDQSEYCQTGSMTATFACELGKLDDYVGKSVYVTAKFTSTTEETLEDFGESVDLDQNGAATIEITTEWTVPRDEPTKDQEHELSAVIEVWPDQDSVGTSREIIASNTSSVDWDWVDTDCEPTDPFYPCELTVSKELCYTIPDVEIVIEGTEDLNIDTYVLDIRFEISLNLNSDANKYYIEHVILPDTDPVPDLPVRAVNRERLDLGQVYKTSFRIKDICNQPNSTHILYVKLYNLEFELVAEASKSYTFDRDNFDECILIPVIITDKTTSILSINNVLEVKYKFEMNDLDSYANKSLFFYWNSYDGYNNRSGIGVLPIVDTRQEYEYNVDYWVINYLDEEIKDIFTIEYDFSLWPDQSSFTSSTNLIVSASGKIIYHIPNVTVEFEDILSDDFDETGDFTVVIKPKINNLASYTGKYIFCNIIIDNEDQIISSVNVNDGTTIQLEEVRKEFNQSMGEIIISVKVDLKWADTNDAIDWNTIRLHTNEFTHTTTQ